jgi:hypothetical protein
MYEEEEEEEEEGGEDEEVIYGRQRLKRSLVFYSYKNKLKAP